MNDVHGRVTARQRVAGGRMSLLAVRLFLGTFALIGLALTAGFGPWLLVQASRSQSWSEVSGQVLSAEVSSGTSGSRPRQANRTRFTPEVHYRYAVDGQTYDGNSWSPTGTPSFGTREAALALVPAVGATVKIVVDPDDPTRSALHRGDTRGAKIVFAVGLGFLVMGVVMWRMFERRRRPDPEQAAA